MEYYRCGDCQPYRICTRCWVNISTGQLAASLSAQYGFPVTLGHAGRSSATNFAGQNIVVASRGAHGNVTGMPTEFRNLRPRQNGRYFGGERSVVVSHVDRRKKVDVWGRGVCWNFMEGRCVDDCGKETHPQIFIRDHPHGGTWLTVSKKVPRWLRVLKRIGFEHVNPDRPLTFENKQIFPENAYAQLQDQSSLVFADKLYMIQLKINDEPQPSDPDSNVHADMSAPSKRLKVSERLQPSETLRCKGCDAISSNCCGGFCDSCLAISTEIDEQLDSLNPQTEACDHTQNPALLNPPSSILIVPPLQSPSPLENIADIEVDQTKLIHHCMTCEIEISAEACGYCETCELEFETLDF